MFDKTRLARQFGQSADYYHHHATVQRYAADRLLSWLAECSIPLGKVLEVGCGTGFLSQGLIDLLPEYDLEISDLSPQILRFCQDHLILDHSRPEQVKFLVLDGENLPDRESPDDRYSLITSSFVLQWFQSVQDTIQNFYRCLKPEGVLLLSFPSDHSFPELKAYCSDRQVPYPFNPLPNFKTIVEMLYQKDLCCEYRTEWYSETYPNLRAVCDHLKNLGAGLKTKGIPLSYSQMKILLEPDKNTEFKVSYHLVFLCIYAK
jgi:malonyl-CoA O-methyltransferase